MGLTHSRRDCSARSSSTSCARRRRPGRWPRTTWGWSSKVFDGVLARGRVAPLVSDEAWLRAMLEAEVALARARELPPEVLEAIAAACDPAAFDARELGERAAESGNPVVPLVQTLRARLTGAASEEVHRGATSQDILDTAAMLVARAALVPLREDLAGAANAAER